MSWFVSQRINEPNELSNRWPDTINTFEGNRDDLFSSCVYHFENFIPSTIERNKRVKLKNYLLPEVSCVCFFSYFIEDNIKWYFGFETNTVNEILSHSYRLPFLPIFVSRLFYLIGKYLMMRMKNNFYLFDLRVYSSTLFWWKGKKLLRIYNRQQKCTTTTECQLINFYWWYFQWSEAVFDFCFDETNWMDCSFWCLHLIPQPLQCFSTYFLFYYFSLLEFTVGRPEQELHFWRTECQIEIFLFL